MSHVYFTWERLDLSQVRLALSSFVLDLQQTPDGFSYFQDGGGVPQLSSLPAGICGEEGHLTSDFFFILTCDFSGYFCAIHGHKKSIQAIWSIMVN